MMNIAENELSLVSTKSFGTSHPGNTARLMKFFNEALRNDRRKINYSEAGLDLAGHLAFDYLVDASSQQIVTGCGVYNGGRYPEGIYRIMNRVFVNPVFREKVNKYHFLGTRLILPVQLELHKERILFPFVSREGKNGHHFLKLWAEFANQQNLGSWRVSEGYAHVAPKGRDKSCFQRIAYRDQDSSPFEEINHSQWQELEG